MTQSEFSPTVTDESEQRLLSPAESASLSEYGTSGNGTQPPEDEPRDSEIKDQSEQDLKREKARERVRRYNEDMKRNKRQGA